MPPIVCSSWMTTRFLVRRRTWASSLRMTSVFFATNAARSDELLHFRLRPCLKFNHLEYLFTASREPALQREHDEDFHPHPESSDRSKHPSIGDLATRRRQRLEIKDKQKWQIERMLACSIEALLVDSTRGHIIVLWSSTPSSDDRLAYRSRFHLVGKDFFGPLGRRLLRCLRTRLGRGV